jgi:hypothetical protein
MMRWSGKHSKDEADTHLLMNGGKLLVPNQDLPLFYAEFARSVLRGETNFLCEKRSAERLRLCVDLDLYATEACTHERMCALLSIAAGVSRDFFGDSGKCLDIVVLASDPHPDEKNGIKCVKTGIHLVWESLTVELRAAGIFRDALVQCYELSTLDVPIGGWGIAIDSAICKHGILRMLYTHKYSDCNSCRNKKALRVSCQTCLTTGKIDIKRPYTLKAVWIQTTKTLEPVPSATTVASIADHLARASIRTDEAAVSMNATMPAWFENSMFLPIELSKNGDARKNRTRRAELLQEGHGSVDGLLQKEPIGGELLKKIEKYIRRVSRNELLNKAYIDVGITQAFYALDRELIIAKADSSFCMNTRNEHRSNTIYFELRRRGAECRQKCFCRCDTQVGRRHGLCSRFQSHPVIIAQSDFAAFFPQHTQQQNVTDTSSQAGSHTTQSAAVGIDAFLAQPNDAVVVGSGCSALRVIKNSRPSIEYLLAGREVRPRTRAPEPVPLIDTE